MIAHLFFRWGFVVHGAIDGKSRLIPYLRAATYNTAEAAGHFFMEGIREFSTPSRVRADHGVEFVKVGRAMNFLRGENRGSFIQGKSVHNQRIERLWRDVFTKVLHLFYTLFDHMEKEQVLDINSDKDLFCLQYVFTPRIDMALKTWATTHNSHRVRTEGNRTPQMMWLESLINAPETATAAQDIDSQRLDDCMREMGIPRDSTDFSSPRYPCPVPMHLLEAVDVRRHSESHGLDVYGQMKTIVDSYNG